MTDNIVPIIPCLDPDNVLENAKGNYENVLLIGWDKAGNFDCRHGGDATLTEAFYRASLFCHKVMNGDYNE